MAKKKPTRGMTTRRASSALPDTKPGGAAVRASSRARSTPGSPSTKSNDKPRKARTPANKPRRLPPWKKVRVWWPPTRDKRKTDYGGAYWPAKVTERLANGLRVEYDNGDIEVVEAEHLSPATVPVGFGEEHPRLQVGEYCEVFNDSKTDPAAWVARIQKVGRGNYTIEFPFHDSSDEVVKEERIRRARVYNEEEKTWKFINPAQEWEDGEVTSPVELELLSSMKELSDAIKKKTKQKPKPKLKAARKSATPWQPSSKRSEEKSSKKIQEKKRRVEEDPNHSTALASSPQPAPIPSPPGAATGQEDAAMSQEVTAQQPTGAQLSSNIMLMQQLAGMGMLVAPNLGQDNQGPPGSPPRPKRKKDANAPKKPKSAYVVFMEKHRVLLKESDPKLMSQDIMKKIGELWSQCSAEEKKECEQVVEEDRKRYQREIADYAPGPDAVEKPVKRRKSNKPKRPMSAYLLFSREYRAGLEAMPFSDATKKTAEAWHKLSAEEARKYEQEAAIMKDKYESEMKEYDAKVAQQQKDLQLQQQAALLRGLSALRASGIPLMDSNSPGTASQMPGGVFGLSVTDMLGKLDLNKVRGTILRTFTQEAYYSLCDVWREGSERVGDAIRAFNSHILGRERRPDWRGFFVSVFGVEKMMHFLKQDKSDKPTPVPSDIDDGKADVDDVSGTPGGSADPPLDPLVEKHSKPKRYSLNKPQVAAHCEPLVEESVKPVSTQQCEQVVDQHMKT